MAEVKVIGMFDDRGALERAKDALTRAGLATDATMRVEPDATSEVEGGPPRHIGVWQRLKALFGGKGDEEAGIYAEAVRRGSLLLVVAVPEEQAAAVRKILRENGAAEIRRRVRRWMGAGWAAVDPAGLGFTEEEIVEERLRCIDERSAAPDDDAEGQGPRDIRLFDEVTGREIGRISEAELAVLQDALEEEGPDDSDYWINPDEIDDIACRPGATRHLVSVLRVAVGDNPDGIDIAFQREGEPKQSLRGSAGTARGGA
jgi:hypothetical protein